ALDAIMAVHQMQDAVGPFNDRLAAQGLPAVSMRAGITTGMMVVGDAGSLDEKFRANDYTVLGDEVNLASRLEGANKALESRLLMSARTAELVSDQFL